MKIGQALKLKTTGELVRLQGVSRCISRGTLDGSVRHYVELSFQAVGEHDLFTVKIPFDERLKPDAKAVELITEAILHGTPVPKSEPHDLLAASESL